MARALALLFLAGCVSCGGDEFKTSGTGGASTGGAAGTAGAGGAGSGGGGVGGTAGGGGAGATGGVGGAGGSGATGATGGTGGTTGSGGVAGSGATGATGGVGGCGGAGSGGTGASCAGPPGDACANMNVAGSTVDNDCELLGAPPTSVNSQPGDGCSDGTREGFFDVLYTDIAACAGGWTEPGVMEPNYGPKPTTCERVSGNSSCNANGTCCSVEDLCAEGWHVCATAAEVQAASGGTGCDANGMSPGFYLTRQGMTTGTTPVCQASTFNNLVGCGDNSTLGHSPSSCTPLSRFWHRWDCCCGSPAGWWCNTTTDEAITVRKTGPFYGGVLCCRSS